MIARFTTPVALVLACSFDSDGSGQGAASVGHADSSTSGGREGTTAFGSTGETPSGTGTGTATGAATATATATGAPAESGSTLGDDEGSESTGSIEDPWCDASDHHLVACYDFQKVDEIAAGLLIDASIHGNDGSIVDVDGDFGPLGHAVSFDGDSQAQVPDSNSLNLTTTGTIEVFVRVDVLPGTWRVGLLDNEWQYSIFLFADQGLRCDYYGRSVFAPFSQEDVGQWVHVACVLGDGEHRMYVDGDLVGQVTFEGTPDTSNTDPLVIGNDSPTFNDPLVGAIGGVRVWSRALDPTELCLAAGPLCDG
jgi:hypothetical protein